MRTERNLKYHWSAVPFDVPQTGAKAKNCAKVATGAKARTKESSHSTKLENFCDLLKNGLGLSEMRTECVKRLRFRKSISRLSESRKGKYVFKTDVHNLTVQ